MDTLAKANIFFFITTIAVVILTILLIITLIYVIKTVKIIQHSVTKIKDTVDSSAEYIEEVKNTISRQGALVTLVNRFLPKTKKIKK